MFRGKSKWHFSERFGVRKHLNVQVNSMINLKYLVKVYFKQGHFHTGRKESQFVLFFHIEFGEECDQRTHDLNEIMSMTIFETFIWKHRLDRQLSGLGCCENAPAP